MLVLKINQYSIIQIVYNVTFTTRNNEINIKSLLTISGILIQIWAYAGMAGYDLDKDLDLCLRGEIDHEGM